MPHKIAIIAGETSGDQLGGWLMESLKNASRIRHHEPHFIGIGGERMQAQGLKSLFPMREISLFGIFEIIPHIFNLKRRMRETVEFIEHEKPDVLVTIDCPGFVLRVVKMLRERNQYLPRLIHYVAPTVWAYRPWRAKVMAERFDHLLTLFPFEPPYFEKEGLKTDCVGHQIAWEWKTKGDGASFRIRHGIAENAPLLAIFPGSRHGEIKRLFPVIAAAVKKLQEQLPTLRVVIQVPTALKIRMTAATRAWPLIPIVLGNQEEKKDFFAAATAALSKSGTIALECALAGLPSVIAYKLNSLTYRMVRRTIQIDYAHIANLMENREIVPELIQENCTAEKLSDTLLPLLTNESARNAQRGGLTKFAAALGAEDTISPSDKAATLILESLRA